MNTEPRRQIDRLIALLDDAVGPDPGCVCCHKVKDVLHDVVASGHDFLDPEFLAPAPDRYARRLLHRDPAQRYSVLAMVWDKGQGTALHDHAGMWCVECVYRGRIKVQSYDLKTDESADLLVFKREKMVIAGIADAGALIPPFDYHTIENADDTPAVTLHVYGGEMTWCHAFVPVEGGYRRETRQLTYTA